MPHGDFSDFYQARSTARPCPVPLLASEQVKRTEGHSSPTLAEADYVVMERERRAMEIVAASEDLFLQREHERLYFTVRIL